MKSPYVTLGALIGLAILSTTSFAAVEEKHWVTPVVSTHAFHSITYQDEITAIQTFPHLSGEKYGVDNTNWNRYLCASTADSHCAGVNQFSYTSILPVCSSSVDTDCVESLSSLSSMGIESEGKFLSYSVPNHVNKFPGDSTLGLPHTETPSIWDLPSAPHNFGTQYAVAVGISGYIHMQGNSNVTQSELYAYLLPVSTINSTDPREESPGKLGYDALWEAVDAQGFSNTPGYASAVDDCTISLAEKGKCLTTHNFPEGFRYKLKIRLAKEPTGWLHGRMVDPNIKIESTTTGSSVTVTAGSTNVPVFYHGDLSANLTEAAKKFWHACLTDGSCASALGTKDGIPMDNHRELTQDYEDSLNLWANAYGHGELALQGIKVFAPLVGDKAVALPTAWSFRTLSIQEMNGADTCFTNGQGLKGIVTTNATAYSAGPPAMVDGSLNYKVASAHYSPDGSVYHGNYNLVVKSEVARCIYKFTSAPIKASIEVVSENGDKSNIATTVSNEKDGWLYLSANNFTFSAPTVKVRLTQDAPVVITPAPVETKTPVVVSPVPETSKAPVVKKITITCVKGKTSKKVTAVKPTCPSGYKKK